MRFDDLPAQGKSEPVKSISTVLFSALAAVSADGRCVSQFAPGEANGRTISDVNSKVSASFKEESMATRRSSDIPASSTARTGTPRVAARPPKSVTPQPTRVTLTAEMRRTMIAENAYLRAERRGFAPGHETEDWLAAEAEIDALLKVSHGGSPQ